MRHISADDGLAPDNPGDFHPEGAGKGVSIARPFAVGEEEQRASAADVVLVGSYLAFGILPLTPDTNDEGLSGLDHSFVRFSGRGSRGDRDGKAPNLLARNHGPLNACPDPVGKEASKRPCARWQWRGPERPRRRRLLVQVPPGAAVLRRIHQDRRKPGEAIALGFPRAGKRRLVFRDD